MKYKKLLVGALASILTLSGCKSNSANYDQKFDTKVYQDFITIGNDYETLNYLLSMKAVDGRVTSNFEDSLVSINKYGQTVGALAESWDHNEDYSVWTFHLRDGLK